MDNHQSADELLASLQSQENREGPLRDWSRCQLYYLQGRWAELLPICAQHYGDGDPLFLIGYLRARAELGEISSLIEESEQHWPRIEQLPLLYRQLYFVLMFAFTGQPALVERAAQSYRDGPDPYSYDFWLATAHMAAGDRARAAPLLAEITQHGDQVWQDRIRQRLDHPPAAHPQLSDEAQALLPTIEERWKYVPSLREGL